MTPAARAARWADWTAPWMFWASVTFLFCQSVLIVLWVDVPSLRESSLTLTGQIDEAELREALSLSHGAAIGLERVSITLMLLIWPLVVVESLVHLVCRPKTREVALYHVYTLLFMVCPSLRMCARSWEFGGRLWLPWTGWKHADRRLRRRLERQFSVPMIAIALLILPVLVTEFFLKDQVARYTWLRVALHASTGVIWFAFATEFILMISIAEKKIAYMRAHWVDLVIISLPLFSFLRSMQAVRGTRLAKMAKLPMVTKLFRAYRLRGTAAKGFRALVLLDVLRRFARTTSEEELERLRDELAILERERRLVRLSIARLQRLQRERQNESVDDS